MPFTAKQRALFHAKASRGAPGFSKLADEADTLAKHGAELPPVKSAYGGQMRRYAGGGEAQGDWGMGMDLRDVKPDKPMGMDLSDVKSPQKEAEESAMARQLTRRPTRRMAGGGAINDDYMGEEGVASYEGSEEDRDEVFGRGGEVECPHCGNSFRMMDDGGDVSPPEDISEISKRPGATTLEGDYPGWSSEMNVRDLDEEDGKVESHPGPTSVVHKRGSFGSALRKAIGRRD